MIEVVVVDAAETAMGMEGCVGWNKTLMLLVTENVKNFWCPAMACEDNLDGNTQNQGQ